MNYCRTVIFILFVFLAVTWKVSITSAYELPSGTVVKSAGDILILKLKYDMSLYELISKSGFSIADENVVSFVADFSGLNEDMKIMSSLRKGTTVKIPLAHLKKENYRVEREPQKRELQAIQNKIVVNQKRHSAIKIPDETESERDMLVRNIETLIREIDGNARIDKNSFKLFSVNERSELSLDSTYFPAVIMDGRKEILIDMHGVLPSEIRDLIEISWPEYRIINLNSQTEMKPVITGILELMGYNVVADRKISSGGRTQVEYFADLVAFSENGDLLEKEIYPIGIVAKDRNATPHVLIEWFRNQDIRIVELSYDKKPKILRGAAGMVSHLQSTDFKRFTEDFLHSLGYSFRKDETINLSDKKEFSFTLKADLSVFEDSKRKIIEYVDLSEYEIQFAKRKGFDIISLRSWDDRKEIIRRILGLLSLQMYTEIKETVAFINPRGVKYRLFSPGFLVRSEKGSFFVTDSELNPDLMRAIVDERINLITF